MKITGVSDIPKFGLLVFLGHPNAHDNNDDDDDDDLCIHQVSQTITMDK